MTGARCIDCGVVVRVCSTVCEELINMGETECPELKKGAESVECSLCDECLKGGKAT